MKFMPGALGGGGGSDFYSLIRRTVGIEGLLLCLDAGSRRSFNPDVDDQIWRDISGNERHWYRGSGATATTQDPSFNGTPGGLSEAEFWSFDGGDFFSQVTANYFAEPLALNGGQGTAIAIASVGDVNGNGFPVFFGGGPATSSNDQVAGYRFNMSKSLSDKDENLDRYRIGCAAGGPTAAGGFGYMSYTNDGSVPRPELDDNTMYFAAASHADQGNIDVYYNKAKYTDSTGGSTKNLTGTVASTVRPYFIGSSYVNAGQYAASAGSKLWAFALFDTQKAQGPIEALYDLCRSSGRFPSLPI